MSKLPWLLLAFGLLALPSISHADSVITGGTGGGNASFNGNWTQGYDFATANSLRVTELGVFDDNSDGLGGTYQIGLWDTVSQSLLGSVFVDSSSTLGGPTILGGQYRYGTLGTTIDIGPGTYTLAAFLPVDTPAPFFTTFTAGAGITLGDRRFDNVGFAFPTGTTNGSSGLVNAQFSAIPEPATAAWIGLAAIGLGLFQRQG